MQYMDTSYSKQSRLPNRLLPLLRRQLALHGVDPARAADAGGRPPLWPR